MHSKNDQIFNAFTNLINRIGEVLDEGGAFKIGYHRIYKENNELVFISKRNVHKYNLTDKTNRKFLHASYSSFCQSTKGKQELIIILQEKLIELI